jgi:hypothetical protein
VEAVAENANEPPEAVTFTVVLTVFVVPALAFRLTVEGLAAKVAARASG